MFSYYLALGARALSRNSLITALMVILIAVGVAGSVTTFAILSAASADPLPARSKTLFVAQIDNRGPASRVTTSGDPDPELTYRDAVALRDAKLGARQSTIYPIREIGIRRALGATRLEIAAHILTENFFMVSSGIAVGAVLAFVANLALMRFLEMSSLPAIYIAIGSFLVLILGQCSALMPARHAARVSPMQATSLNISL